MPFAVITGASDGIGRALALELARRGFRLGLIARRTNLLAETARECDAIRHAPAEPSVFAAVDVTKSEELRAQLQTWWHEHGGIDLYVANAGLGLNTSDVKDSFSDMKSMIEVNVTGAVAGLELLKEKMCARGSGTLVGITSVASARGMPKTGGYCLTKAALHSYLEALRMDVRKTGVNVCEVAPGYIDTAMTKPNAFHMPFLMRPEKFARKAADRILKKKKFTVLPWQFRYIYPILKNAPECLVEAATAEGI